MKQFNYIFRVLPKQTSEVLIIVLFLLSSPLLAQNKGDFIIIKVTKTVIESKENFFTNGKIVPNSLFESKPNSGNFSFENPKSANNTSIQPPTASKSANYEQLDSLLRGDTEDIFDEILNELVEKENSKEKKDWANCGTN